MEPDDASSSSSAHAALMAAVEAGRTRDVAKLGRLCAKSGDLDRRAAPLGAEGHATCAAALAGYPHHLLSYFDSAEASLEEMLVAGVNDEPIDRRPLGWCRGGDRCCTGGRLTPLQLACTKLNAVDSVRILLQLGARADLPMCFQVDAEDTPNARALQRDGEECCAGIAGFSALRLARHRGLTHAVRLLEEYGASVVDTSAHPESECPICYEPLDEDSDGEGAKDAAAASARLHWSSSSAPPTESGGAVVTTPCAHRFHARCLPLTTVRNCPLCRTPLWCTDAPHALEHYSQQQQQPQLSQQHHHHRQQHEDPARPPAPLPGPALRAREIHDAAVDHDPSVRSPPARGASAYEAAAAAGVPSVPPWLRSPVWVRSAERTYSEIERRRL